MGRLKHKINTALGRNSNYNPYFYKNQAAKLGPFKRMTMRDLVNLESQLGATIFGATPTGHERKFFNLDEDTWIWYESWTDSKGHKHETTTRYEIQQDKIIKIQPGPRYYTLKGKELDNFKQAVRAYHKMILGKIYSQNGEI